MLRRRRLVLRRGRRPLIEVLMQWFLIETRLQEFLVNLGGV